MHKTPQHTQQKILDFITFKSGLGTAVEGYDVLIGPGRRVPVLISIKTPSTDLPFALIPFDEDLRSPGIQFHTAYGDFPAEIGVIVFAERLPLWATTAFEQHGIGYVDLSEAFFLPLKFNLKHPLTNEAQHARVTRGQREHLILALLSQPNLNHQSQRQIAREIGLPHSTVSHGLNMLAKEGSLEIEKRGLIKLQVPRLIDHWLEFYSSSISQLTQAERFRATTKDYLHADWPAALTKGAVYWSGDMAAQRLNLGLRPEHFLFYYAGSVRQEVIRMLRLVPDPMGPIEIRKQFWKFSWPGQQDNIAPLLIVYSDLILSRDSRALATAKVIMQRIKNDVSHRTP